MGGFRDIAMLVICLMDVAVAEKWRQDDIVIIRL